MQGTKIMIIAVLLLCALCIGTSVYFYNAYREKAEYFERQNQSVNTKLNTLEIKLSDFRNSLDNFDAQFKSYIENLNNFNQTISSADMERKNILASIEGVKKDIQDLRSSYTTTLEELKGKVANLEVTLDSSKKDAKQKVELGAISVEKSSQKKK